MGPPIGTLRGDCHDFDRIHLCGCGTGLLGLDQMGRAVLGLDLDHLGILGSGDDAGLSTVSERRAEVKDIPSPHSGLQKLVPFLWTGFAWGIVTVVSNSFGMVDPLHAILWSLALWALCMADFFGTAQMVRGMLAVRAGSSTSGGSPSAQALGGGALKLACFGLLGVVVWAGKEAPLRALLMGLGTMIVVPLLGGVWWFKRDHKENSHG